MILASLSLSAKVRSSIVPFSDEESARLIPGALLLSPSLSVSVKTFPLPTQLPETDVQT